MTLLHMNGFEGMIKSGSSIRAGVPTFVAGRTGLCMRCDSTGEGVAIAVTGSPTEVVLGFGLRYVSHLTTSSITFAEIFGPDGAEFALRRNGTSQQIEVCRGSGTVLAAAAGPSWDQWNYVEVYYKMADAGGRIWLKINGATIIDFTGDTKQGGSAAAISSVAVYSGSNSIVEFDDLYLLDKTDATSFHGRPWNDFLGPIKIELLKPTAAGVTDGWQNSALSASANNWSFVDESPPNTADYVQSSLSGSRDLYTFSDPSIATGQVLAVDVVSYAVAPDGGSPPLKSVNRAPSGNSIMGPGAIPGTNWGGVTDGPWFVDGDGAQWTLASVNAAQFGIEHGA